MGNAPQNKQLLETLKRASERGVIIVNCSQCLKGAVKYATDHSLSEAGVISGGDMTTETVIAKLCYLLSYSRPYEQLVALFKKI